MRYQTFRGGVILRLLVVLLLIGVIGAATAYLVITRTPAGKALGGDAVDWAARQVVSIVERTIVPDVGFDRFEYRAPRTLRFVNLTLTAPDGTQVASAETVEVELTKLPKYGEAVYIERIGVKRGLLELLETRDPDGGVGFLGLVPFVEPNTEEQPAQPDRPAQNFDQQRRLSDALQIRLVTLDDCGLRYTPASGDPPMRLAGITTELNITPEDEGGNRWHRFDLDLGRGSSFDAQLAGRVDLDRVIIDLNPSTIALDLTDGPAEQLPPMIQSMLAEYDARGSLRLNVEGSVPVRDFNAARADAGLRLDGFNIAFGEYRVPIDNAQIDLALAQGTATINRGDINAMGGQARLTGAIDLSDDAQAANASWTINGMRLREILRGGTPSGQAPALAGVVLSSGDATMRAGDGLSSLRGQGTVDITQGRFTKFDLLSDLIRLVDTRSQSSREAQLTSEMHGVFTLRGPAVDFSQVELKTPVLAARGNGVFHFDGRLDFVLNGGPLERVQDLLGDVGRIFGAVTDQLVKYRVRGTAGKPDVSIAPLGVGAQVDRSMLP